MHRHMHRHAPVRAALLAAAFGTPHAAARAQQPPAFRVGDAVEVKSRIDTTWARGRVVETSDKFPDVYKVQLDGQSLYMATHHNVNRLRRPGEAPRPFVRPALLGTDWQQVSVTTARGTTTSNGAFVGLRFDERARRWTLTTPVSYGAGVSILGRGTYQLAGNRLVMSRDGGAPYGDFTVSWDDAARLLLLTYRNGGGVMRLRAVEP